MFFMVSFSFGWICGGRLFSWRVSGKVEDDVSINEMNIYMILCRK